MHLTKPTRRLALLLGALALTLPACGDDDGSPNDCAAHLLPGDLVITEIMPNPQGADDGKEWFEVYNATTAAIDLTGVTLVYSRADGSNRKTHLVTGGLIAAGEYRVFGGVLEVAKPAWIDYGYANDLGSLTNTGGRLAVECGNTTVDQVIYLEGDDGVSLGFNGERVPDAVANDTIADWCSAQSEYETDSFGTPGAANDPCATVNPSGTCLDGGVTRNVVAPTLGNVIITELMADPSAVGDAEGEWVELLFTQPADLNGLQLGEVPGTVMHTVADATCLPVAAGEYVLVARSANSALNGGLPPVDVVWPNLGLSNSGGGLFVGYGNAVLDSINYTDPMVDPGKATALDPTHLDATENDDATNWCDATATYGAGDLGTPGAANSSCGIVPQNTCLEGGTPRAIVPPVVGDVVINEIMANPTGTDTDREWFEVYFANAADLNGLQLGTTSGSVAYTVSDANCLHVAAGTYALFARKGDAATNGDLPTVDVVYTTINLINGGGTLIVGYDGAALDTVTYAAATDGVSYSLSLPARDPTQNDTATNWCLSTAATPAATSYGAGGTGTPGAANPTCN